MKIDKEIYKDFKWVWSRVFSELINENPTICPEETKKCLLKVNSLVYKIREEDIFNDIQKDDSLQANKDTGK